MIADSRSRLATKERAGILMMLGELRNISQAGCPQPRTRGTGFLTAFQAPLPSTAGATAIESRNVIYIQ
jgi:hypothetical protein